MKPVTAPLAAASGIAPISTSAVGAKARIPLADMVTITKNRKQSRIGAESSTPTPSRHPPVSVRPGARASAVSPGSRSAPKGMSASARINPAAPMARKPVRQSASAASAIIVIGVAAVPRFPPKECSV